jgi:signal peptidase I
MEKTLLIGDHVFVNRIVYAPPTRWFPIVPYREIQRGDIVVFVSPAEAGLFVVKRVIGVPGDRLHLRDGVVYRNGEPLNEPYVNHCARLNECDVPTPAYYPYRDNFPAVPPSEGTVTPEWHLTLAQHLDSNGDLVVPPNSYFGMGDNRDVSYDSRYWGFIPRENVIGRPLFIYWSFETPPRQYQKTALADRLIFMGKVVIHFFDQTRWRRMLKVVR